MPGGSLGSSYTSLEHVYRGTTLPQPKMGGGGVLDSIKRAFSVTGSKTGTGSDPLIESSDISSSDNAVIVARQGEQGLSNRAKNMPTTIAEEAALLGTMPADSMDDIELRSVQLQFPTPRRLSGDGAATEVRVATDRGDVVVAVVGDRTRPAILTYHDLGLNYVSSFQAFFTYVDMRALLENFCVYHVNAPGQEEGAPTLPEDFLYPTMDELASQINFVLGHFGIKSFIGFGVGAGANVLARFSLQHPEKVDALCLVNCVSTQAGWIEWGYQKLNARHLRSRGMTQGVLDYLMWHHFGRGTEDRNHDLIQVYRAYFSRSVNPTNLSLFIDAYVRRSDLNIARESDTLRVPVMNVTGALSPHVEDTVTLNGRLNPVNSTWMKISDCGMVLEEQPGKVSEAFRLFLQGEGYVAPLSPSKITAFRRASIEELRRAIAKQQEELDKDNADSLPAVLKNAGYDLLGIRSFCADHSPIIHITENPISEAVAC